MKTTLNKIRERKPCGDGWERLLAHLGKTKADDDPLPIRTILESNGLYDALWCLCAVEGHDREIRLLAVKYSRKVQPLMTDPRSIAALDVAERYAGGEATEEDLDAAREEAMAASASIPEPGSAGWAAWAAKAACLKSPVGAAGSAALAEGCGLGGSAGAAAMSAARAEQEAEFRAMLARCEEQSQ